MKIVMILFLASFLCIQRNKELLSIIPYLTESGVSLLLFMYFFLALLLPGTSGDGEALSLHKGEEEGLKRRQYAREEDKYNALLDILN